MRFAVELTANASNSDERTVGTGEAKIISVEADHELTDVVVAEADLRTEPDNKSHLITRLSAGTPAYMGLLTKADFPVNTRLENFQAGAIL